MNAWIVIRGTWMGLVRSPLWIGSVLLGLALSPALVFLSPFPEGPESGGLWVAVARWGVLVSLGGLLAALVRLAELEPFLRRVPHRARAWGEIGALASAAGATWVPLVAGAWVTELLTPGRLLPPAAGWLGLGLAVAHGTALAALIAQWVPRALGRFLALTVGALALPALLPAGGLPGRILLPLVDVSASIGYPSTHPSAAAALLIAFPLLLAVRFARPLPA